MKVNPGGRVVGFKVNLMAFGRIATGGFALIQE
jgi:hypothetical protein